MKMVPHLWFDTQAVAAAEFYADVFSDSAVNHTTRLLNTPGGLIHYGESQPPHQAGTVMFNDLTLGKMWLAMLDGPGSRDFTFNEGASLIVYCDDLAEVDQYWDSLIADPASGQCGWLKDAWGVSWQVVPDAMHDMWYGSIPAQIERVMRVALTQKKFDIAAQTAAHLADD